MRIIPKILVFAGSVRTGAFSGKTASAAAWQLAALGAEVTRISLEDYPLPLMDEDLEKAEGVPPNALNLARQIAVHDGLLIASPEYNSSIPPLLKNALDWVSRVRQDGARPFRPYRGKVAALCSASDGNFAGIRGLYHLRSVLIACQVEVVTPQCSVPRAAEAFDADGRFREERLRSTMETVCSTLIERAAMMSTRVEI